VVWKLQREMGRTYHSEDGIVKFRFVSFALFWWRRFEGVIDVAFTIELGLSSCFVAAVMECEMSH
jgi:hypothetical protein